MSGTSLPFKAPTSHKILIKLFRSTVGTLASFIALVQTHFSWQGLTIKDCWACMRCCIKVSEELPVSKFFFYLITSYEHFTSACSKILKSFFKALLVVSHWICKEYLKLDLRVRAGACEIQIKQVAWTAQISGAQMCHTLLKSYMASEIWDVTWHDMWQISAIHGTTFWFVLRSISWAPGCKIPTLG